MHAHASQNIHALGQLELVPLQADQLDLDSRQLVELLMGQIERRAECGTGLGDVQVGRFRDRAEGGQGRKRGADRASRDQRRSGLDLKDVLDVAVDALGRGLDEVLVEGERADGEAVVDVEEADEVLAAGLDDVLDGEVVGECVDMGQQVTRYLEGRNGKCKA